MYDSFRVPLAIAGRVLLAAILLVGPLANLVPNFTATADAMRVTGVPAPPIALALAIGFLLAGSVSLIAGYRSRWGVGLLIAFLIPATLFLHAPWHATDAAGAAEQAVHFLENIGLAGALLLIVAIGSGPGSLDNRKTAHECLRQS